MDISKEARLEKNKIQNSQTTNEYQLHTNPMFHTTRSNTPNVCVNNRTIDLIYLFHSVNVFILFYVVNVFILVY